MAGFVQYPQFVEDGPRLEQSHGSIGGHGCAKQEKCANRGEASRALIFVSGHFLAAR
jgi:hypothetical protein